MTDGVRAIVTDRNAVYRVEVSEPTDVRAIVSGVETEIEPVSAVVESGKTARIEVGIIGLPGPKGDPGVKITVSSTEPTDADEGDLWVVI